MRNRREGEAGWLYEQATDLLKRSQEFRDRSEIGVKEATVSPRVEYPSLPLVSLMATDLHYGSINGDYKLLDKHLRIVEDTPNTYLLSNGDEVDNFNAIFFSSGAFENPLPPQLQTAAFLDRFQGLVDQGKVLGMSFGNHNNFMEDSGYSWLETFGKPMHDKGVPIFPTGGYLHLEHGEESYGIAMTHKFWGYSKLNPTNMPKRFLEYEFGGQADVAFLGHTHQSELLTFNKAGREQIALVGGTYKKRDDWAATRGIGHRSGDPGMAIMFFPDRHHMVAFKHIEDAQQMMLGLIWQEEAKRTKPERSLEEVRYDLLEQ